LLRKLCSVCRAFASYILTFARMINTNTNRRGSVVALGAIVGAILLIFFLVRSCTQDVTEVRATSATRQNLEKLSPTNGKVEPIMEYQAHADFAGTVEKVYVDVGQKVKPGDLLVKMKDTEVDSKVAAANSALISSQADALALKQGGTQEERLNFASDLSKAQLQQSQAASNLAVVKKLQEKGAASEAEVAVAQQRLESANSSLLSIQERSSHRYNDSDRARSKAQLENAQAALLSAQAGYGNFIKRSPIAGTVYSIPVSDYDFVQAGEDLLDVANLDRIRVRAYFDEPEIGSLASGQAVKITWDAKPGRVWHGHVETAPTTVISYGTRSVGECIITVDDANGDLLPNTNVNVSVTILQRFNVLSLPREALHTEGAVNFVYRVIGGKLVRTPVQVGVVSLTRVEILSGISEKDTVALNAMNSRDLSNGLAVKIVE
jgi:HlyD family secretion protein